MDSTDLLTWESLTETVNEIKPANSFAWNLLYAGSSEPKETKQIELSFYRRSRRIAPFVKRGSEARMIGGYKEQAVIVESPHVRIKMPFHIAELMNTRRVGTQLFPGADGIRAAIEARIARNLGLLTLDLDQTLEWMACQTLRGVISYQSADDEAFTITIPRSATHDFDLPATEHWDEVNADIAQLFQDVMELTHEDVSINPTDVILGDEAADLFVKDAAIQALLKNNPNNAILTGQLSAFITQMQANGAQFLGAPFHNIRVWRYGRSVEVNGVSEKLIRPKYAEFVCAVPEAQNTVYYGPIEDFEAFGEGGSFVRERFAKSWVEKDPSQRLALLESNPLPCPRRPDSTTSVKVVSG